MNTPIKNLVFEGGGVLGAAYQGVYEALEEQGLMPRIEKIAGTSTGAIAALILSLGYTAAECKQILLDLDMRKLTDGGTTGIFRIFTQFGWYKGDKLLHFFEKLIADKLDNPKATFQDFYEAGMLDLYLIGTNVSKNRFDIFSYKTTPDMEVAKAVRISMSVLFFFAAQTYKGDYFVDGGALLNYAIQIFDREVLKLHLSRSPKDETLGFYFNKKVPDNRIKGIPSYLKALFNTLFQAQYQQLIHSPDDLKRTVFIEVLGIRDLDFNISKAQKLALMAEGKKATLAHLENRA
ncbi:patatin-like phospholipase family protein [Hugenholtzia roseola]|uniref:patatin-like phospholipase family protein n=1 Tax=Hugenholtzia roseola TaxID=1002 RepID=UPI00041880B7|nr:patatin-like phospholipase family protein [Hugenholtzia roseola]